MAAKTNILFVDDDPNFLQSLEFLLEEKQDEWAMAFVHSADEALGKVKDALFDVIVSDVTMPRKSGLDLLAELQELPEAQNIPVIILTGNADFSMKRKALDLGATDLLNKPVVLEDLVARIRNTLRLKAYQDELKNQNERLEQMVRKRTAELERSRLEIIWRLAKAGEYRDGETGNHVVRVAYYCQTLAKGMKLGAEFREWIFLTSPLHDIGKIGIPDGILLKPGELTGWEREMMERHCEIGAEILLQKPRRMKKMREKIETLSGIVKHELANPIVQMAAKIALTHHEHWDGGGYPKGLSGDAIPLEGRIVALADYYDALRSRRPYKAPVTRENTEGMIHQLASKHFDPEVFEVFESSVHKFNRIFQEFSDDSSEDDED